jgi:putative ABC transport system substrate-binding protein
MNRRDTLLALLALGAVPRTSFAQQQGKVWRVGILSQSNRTIFDPFLRGMRELGYVEGKNLAIDWRYAENKLERIPAMAVELVALKPDAIVSAANDGPMALQRATNTIPIIMTSPSDPVASGLVKSLARPGGNITGNSGIDLSAKRLQLLLELVPNASPVGFFLRSGNPVNRAYIDGLNAAAKAAGISILPLEMRNLQEIENAFAAMVRQKARAMIVSPDPLFSSNNIKLAEFAVKYRLPYMAAERQYVEAGAMISYGANYAAMFHHAASYVDKIFRGAKPADLPVEQPTKFEMSINLKTAKALGLKVPQSLLARADEVIQ